MTETANQWRDARVLAGKLLAARDFLEKHPEAPRTVRADMRQIVREACECTPVHGTLIGLAVLLQYERTTGRTVKPSQDAKPELAALRALVDAITTKLDAADDADKAASGPTLH